MLYGLGWDGWMVSSILVEHFLTRPNAFINWADGGGRQEIKRGWPPIPPHPTHHPVSRPATQPASLPAPGVKGLAIATSGGAPGKEVAPYAAGAHAHENIVDRLID